MIKPSTKPPLVIGHPKTDTPAYGWVDSLYFVNGLLNAYPSAVTAEFAGWVNDGFYKKMSSSFYPPSHHSNPVPGVYYLKHIGFLGGCPPAVKGLPDAAFSDHDGLVSIDFSENILLPTKEAYQIAIEARAYHDKQRALGNNISFSEAVDTVMAIQL
jgi:hypothetical protein